MIARRMAGDTVLIAAVGAGAALASIMLSPEVGSNLENGVVKPVPAPIPLIRSGDHCPQLSLPNLAMVAIRLSRLSSCGIATALLAKISDVN